MSDVKCMMAKLICSQSLIPEIPVPLNVTSQQIAFIDHKLIATQGDVAAVLNVPAFGSCKTTYPPSPCVPVLTAWQKTGKVLIKGRQVLTNGSSAQCSRGGKVEFFPCPPGKVHTS